MFCWPGSSSPERHSLSCLLHQDNTWSGPPHLIHLASPFITTFLRRSMDWRIAAHFFKWNGKRSKFPKSPQATSQICVTQDGIPKAEWSCLGKVRKSPDVAVTKNLKCFLLNVHVIRSWETTPSLLEWRFLFSHKVAFFPTRSLLTKWVSHV